MNASEDALAKAAYRWRLKIQSTRVGAFEPFNVILRTSRNNQLITLIEAGGGKVINIPEYASHFIIGLKQFLNELIE